MLRLDSELKEARDSKEIAQLALKTSEQEVKRQANVINGLQKELKTANTCSKQPDLAMKSQLRDEVNAEWYNLLGMDTKGAKIPSLHATMKLKTLQTNQKKISQQLEFRTQQIHCLGETIRDFTFEIEDLKEERENRRPLFEVGIAVRTRFLLKTTEIVKSYQLSSQDIELIKRGSRAMYNGNGSADEALLITGVLSEKRWGPIFEHLYDMDAGMFKYQPKDIQSMHVFEVGYFTNSNNNSRGLASPGSRKRVSVTKQQTMTVKLKSHTFMNGFEVSQKHTSATLNKHTRVDDFEIANARDWDYGIWHCYSMF